MKYRIESWQFTKDFHEGDSPIEIHYSSLEAATVALESALAARLQELNNRTDVDVSNPDGERYKITRSKQEGDDYTVRVTWWQHHSQGYTAQKDYFSLSYELFEREVLGK